VNSSIQRMCVLVGLSVSGLVGCVSPLTTGSLIRQMTDLERLADLPSPAFKTVQFSSYDHRSVLPNGPHWFANSDGFGREPLPNFEAVLEPPDEQGIGEYLICDVKGPGAIVRTWTAAITGTIRLYLDDARKPVYDGPADKFLLCPYRAYAQESGIDDTLLDDTFQQRNAAYCPITFAKRCRMVWVGNTQQIHFYHVQIRLYEPGTHVRAFQPSDLKTYERDLRDVARVMSNPQAEYEYRSTQTPTAISTTVPAGQIQEALALEGPQALERLTLKVAAHDLDKALRQTILHIVCDDHPWGQVQAPIGDLFGAAPGVNPFESIPFTVSPDGTMTCRYVMPFKTSLRILIDNRGEQAVSVTGSALPMDYTWNDNTSMHFRARWRVDHDLLASSTPAQDLPYLIANGRGVYVGTATMLLNPTPVPTPGGGWWGEGDEKIFVDDDVQPSTFGTGSEDYFNYAWSSPDIFLFPYCGQPRNDGPGNRGFVTNQRWHVLDCLPFQRRLAFYMELFSHAETPGMSYARIAYHYARPGVVDDHVTITSEDVRHLELPANWQPAARGAVRNTVFHQAEELTQQDATLTFETGSLWSGGRLLVWRPARVGSRLTLDVPIPEDAKYALHLAMALNAHAGRVKVTLDGNNIGVGGESGIIDLHVPHRTLLRQYSSKTIELTKGTHTLALEYTGAPGQGTEGTVGIDYVGVQKT